MDEGIYIAQMVAETGLFKLNNKLSVNKQKCTYVVSFFLTLFVFSFQINTILLKQRKI